MTRFLGSLALVLAAVSLAAAQVPTFPSCAGICGNLTAFRRATNGNSVCFCDAACAAINVCCPDYTATCTGATPAPTPPVSTSMCLGNCNTSFSAVLPNASRCYCDTECTSLGNCCPDYASECSAVDPNPSMCAGNCNSTFTAITDSGRCFCDEACVGAQNCCADYAGACLVVSDAPTTLPTTPPSDAPSEAPSEAPTSLPTELPTTEMPTNEPTGAPTNAPSRSPSDQPTHNPTAAPNAQPTLAPSEAPTVTPSQAPTASPSANPTEAPSGAPTEAPTEEPTVAPTTMTTTTTTVTTTTTTATSTTRTTVTVDRFIQTFTSATPFTFLAPPGDSAAAAANIQRFQFAFFQRLHVLGVAQSLLTSELSVTPDSNGQTVVRAVFTDPREESRATSVGITCQVNFPFGQVHMYFAVSVMAVGACDPSTSTTTTTTTDTSTTRTQLTITSQTTTTETQTTSTTTSSATITSGSTTTTFSFSPTRSPTMPPTLNPTLFPSARPTVAPTNDICRVHTCALFCTTPCGWRSPTDPNSNSFGECVTGEVTEAFEELLGCDAPELTDRVSAASAGGGDDDERTIYFIVAICIVLLVGLLLVVGMRQRRKKNSYDVSDTTVLGPLQPLPNTTPTLKTTPDEEESIKREAEKAYAAIAEEARLRQAEESVPPHSPPPLTPTITLAPPPKRVRPASTAPPAKLVTPPITKIAQAEVADSSKTAAVAVAEPVGSESGARWFHGVIDRESAEARIQRTGIANGRFLVRQRDPSIDDYVIAIGYNGRVTHHLVKRNANDLLVVNKMERFGLYETIEQMVDTLSSFEYLPEGWPVRLSEGVDKETGEFFEMESKAAPRKPAPELEFLQSVSLHEAGPVEESTTDDLPPPPQSVIAAPLSPVSEPVEAPIEVPPEPAALIEVPQPANDEPLPFSEGIWVHDQGEAMSKAQGQAWAKENLLEKDGTMTNGTFALRRHKAENSYVLELIFKQRMTSHMIEVEADVGIITIGKKQYGLATTFDTLIESLATEPLPKTRTGQAWPIRLVQGLDPDTMQLIPVPVKKGEAAPPPPAKAAVKSEAHAAEEAPPPRPAKKEVQSNAGSGGDRPWLHGVSTNKDEDAEKLLDPITRKAKDGHFFVCELDKSSSNYPAYVMIIGYKGKATRHLVKDYGEGLVVNKKSYGKFSTIDELVAALTTSSPPKGWPVPLTHTFDKNTSVLIQVGQSAPAAAAPVTIDFGQKRASSSSVSSNPSWYHPIVNGKELTREEASEIIKDDDQLVDGNFVIREHVASGAPEWVLTVAYKGRPTHHLISTRPDKTLAINKKDFGCRWMTVHELVAQLSASTLPTGWPVKLLTRT